MKYMAMVGSEIFWNGIASGFIRRAERVADVDICNTGNCNDGADTRLVGLLLYSDRQTRTAC